MVHSRYDYIIAGAGLSGLSLAWQLAQSHLSGKKFLIIDASLNPTREKTWCFWYKGSPLFSSLISKTWHRAEVNVLGKTIEDTLKFYPYHCIKSNIYRSFILDELHKHPAVDILEGTIDYMTGDDHEATLISDAKTFSADYIFQSCFAPKDLKKMNTAFPLLQHFLGWEIEVSEDIFDENTVRLMDFDETFDEGIAFMYMLPWSGRKALLEYTIFSPEVKPPAFYEKKLELYLFNKYKKRRLDYRIIRTEFGEIPMQDRPYVPWYAPQILNIGMVGGLTKPSTGYTFSRIQYHTRMIVQQLRQGLPPALPPRSSKKYRVYDLWLLEIMSRRPQEALHIFHDLFTNNSIDEVFRFLGEESSMEQDLKIMSSVPYKPFFQAIWNTRKQILQI